MKYDYYSQLVFCIIIAAVGVFALIPGMTGTSLFGLLGLIPLGLWQLISATINTQRFKNNQAKYPSLKRYWFASLVCLALFFLAFAFRSTDGNNTVTMAMLITSIVGSCLVAIYYLYIYKTVLLPAQQLHMADEALIERVEL